MNMRVDSSRRDFLASLASISLLGGSGAVAADGQVGFSAATFICDVTPPLGHPLMGGGIAPASEIVDRLSLRGVVIVGDVKPIILAVIDWCEIRNDAYEAWRSALALAAGTEPARVLLSSVHQHDAPIADLLAERLLEKSGARGRICDLAFHEKTVTAAAQAVREASRTLQPLTHVGVGTARVDRIASNRRYVGRDGKPRHDRTSATREPAIRNAEEGLIDPDLRCLSFWSGEKPIAVFHQYATHPMSYYGKGGVSADFVGMARRRFEMSLPGTLQVYVSGCSGNVTAGKYNDGATENRDRLADRLEDAMQRAWRSTHKQPMTQLGFRSIPLELEFRTGPGFSFEELEARLEDAPRPFDQCLAALGLSRAISLRNHPAIDVAAVDFGSAHYLLLPAEAYVEFQLAAAAARPDSTVVVAGYGECSPGYIPTDRAFAEDDSNLRDWCWVAPGSERRMIEAIRTVLAR